MQNAIGRAFQLVLTSVCFSPSTVGVRVKLDADELELLDKPEETEWICAGNLNMSQRSFDPKRNIKSKRSLQQYHTLNKSQQSDEGYDGNSFVSGNFKGQKGRSAHITLGTANGVEAHETNYDILRMCDFEANSITNSDTDFVLVVGGKARYFGDGFCCVYFNHPLKVQSLFSGFY